MYGRFDLESFLGILDRSSHMEVRLYFHQLFCGIKKCLMALLRGHTQYTQLCLFLVSCLLLVSEE